MGAVSAEFLRYDDFDACSVGGVEGDVATGSLRGGDVATGSLGGRFWETGEEGGISIGLSIPESFRLISVSS